MGVSRSGELAAPEDAEVLTEVPKEPELFYTEGTSDLLRCRGVILESSLRLAAARIAKQKRKRADPDEDESRLRAYSWTMHHRLGFENSHRMGPNMPNFGYPFGYPPRAFKPAHAKMGKLHHPHSSLAPGIPGYHCRWQPVQ
eukprot:8667156-Pyramimonas_sp.AAC.1